MIEETAVVTEKHDKTVSLEIERKTACGICGQTRGCGNATWGKMLGHHQSSIQVSNVIDANVGDRVVVGIEERAFLNAAFLLYVLPLVALFLGAGIGQVFFQQEIFVIVGAALGLTVGFIGVKKLTNPQSNAGAGLVKQKLSRQYAVLLRFSKET